MNPILTKFARVCGVLCVALLLNVTAVSASDILFTSASSTAWLTAANWTGSVLPTATDNAQFGANPTSATSTLGINGNGTLVPGSQVHDIGAIELTSARSSLNLTIGNSSTSAGKDMILALKATTVNGIANTILRNAGAGSTTLTLQNIQGSGTLTMGVSNFLAGAVIDATSPITISSIFSGKGFTKTGAGTLTLSAAAANTYTTDTTISNGTISIGNDTATLGNGSGTLVLAGGTFFRASQTTAQTFANPISMTASSAIVGNPTTGSRTIPFSSSSVSGSAGTLTVSNSAASGSGLLQVRFSGSFTFARPVVVTKAFSGSGVMLQFYNSAATGDQTWSGLISGSGTMYKNVSSGAGGNTILSSGNSYTGGTELRAGFFGLGADNPFGSGNITVGFDSNPLGLYASGAARQLTNDIVIDWASATASTAAGSTNLQIKGSQDLTLSGRILMHTNIQQFTISNTATTTFSGAVTNVGTVAKGLTKHGPGKLVLSGSLGYIGSTRVAAGILSLSGTAVPSATTNLTIYADATLDISGLSSTWAMTSAQAFQVVNPTASATLIASGSAGLTLGSTSPLLLAYSNGIPSLTVTGGVFTVGNGNVGTVTVANGGVGLPAADYKLISAINGGSVAGTAPDVVAVNGDGLSGSGAFLVLSNSELYLRVTNAPVPPNTPVANTAPSTNVIFFAASWSSASGASGYHLDVATDSGFTSFVSGYNDADVGAVTSFIVTNLSPATIYYYRVRGTNIYGVSGDSATIAVQTLVAPYVWNAGSGNWSDASSWQFANPPINGVLVGFTGAGGNAANNLSDLGLTSLVFSNGAGAYTVSGNPLALTNGILNSSASIQSISTPLTLGAAQTFNASAGPLNISGPVTNAGFTLTMNTVAASTNSGSIAGSGALIKIGAGTLQLAGANTFTGATTNSAGNLEVTGGSALPDTATVSLANTAGVALTVSASETIGSISGGDNSTVALGANNLTVGGDGTTTTLTSAITGAGKLVKTGAGTLTLNKATPYGSDFILRVEGGTVDLNRGGNSLGGILGGTNRIELAGGTLQVSGGVQATLAFTNGGFDVYSNSTIFFTRLVSSATSHANSSPLNFKNNATLTFGYGPNITSGTTTFDAATNTLQGNAVLALGAYDIAIANPIVESGGSYGLTKTGVGQLNLGGINTYSGPTTNLQGTIQVNATSTFGNGSGALVLAGGNILDANTRAGAPIANPILMTANTTVYGNGTLTDGSTRYLPFSANSITTVGGTLTVRNAGASGTNEFRLRFTGGGFNFSQPIIVGSPSDLVSLTSALHIYNDTNVPAQTFSGTISGVGSIVKSAAVAGSGGVTILSGSNSYAGGTSVSEGTLLVNNTTGSGTGTNLVSITSGGALGGTGIILGAVTNSAGSKLQPGLGADTSTLTISNALGLNGTALFVLNRTNAQNSSRVAGLSTVKYGGTLTLTNVGDALQAGDTFTLFSSAAYSGAFTNYILPALDPSLIWVTNSLSANGTVSVALGIAPSSLALSSSANPSGYLDALTFTANVTPGAATGSVIFYNGATPFSTNNLTLGSATSDSISSLLRGSNTITAIYGGSMSYYPSTNSLTQVVTNHPPVAGNVSLSRFAGMSTLHIAITNLLANVTDADADSLMLVATSASTNSATLTTSAGYVHYYNPNNVADEFTYTVSDGFGGTNTATVSIAISTNTVFGQSSPSINTTGGSATLGFAGIPGFSYSVVRSTNVNFAPFDILWTTNAPSGGLFDYTDSAPPQPSAFYRLQWNP